MKKQIFLIAMATALGAPAYATKLCRKLPPPPVTCTSATPVFALDEEGAWASSDGSSGTYYCYTNGPVYCYCNAAGGYSNVGGGPYTSNGECFTKCALDCCAGF